MKKIQTVGGIISALLKCYSVLYLTIDTINFLTIKEKMTQIIKIKKTKIFTPFFVIISLSFLLCSHAFANHKHIDDNESRIVSNVENDNSKSLDICEDKKGNKWEYLWSVKSSKTELLLMSNHANDTRKVINGYGIIHWGENLPEEIKNLGNWQSLECNISLLESQTGMLGSEEKKSLCHEFEKNRKALNKKVDISISDDSSSHDFDILNTEDFLPILLESNNVIFFVGAGLSAKRIDTLPQFHSKLGLDTVPGHSTVPHKQLMNFLPRFAEVPENYYSVATDFCSSLYSLDLEPTEAHYALKAIIQNLKNRGKQVFVYSGNLDMLLESVNIEVCENNNFADMPGFESLIIVVLGSRVDHWGVLSYYKDVLPDTKAFSFNRKKNTKMIKINLVDHSAEGVIKLDGGILGDLQKTLPALQEALEKYSE